LAIRPSLDFHPLSSIALLDRLATGRDRTPANRVVHVILIGPNQLSSIAPRSNVVCRQPAYRSGCTDPADFDGSFNRDATSDFADGVPTHNVNGYCAGRESSETSHWEGVQHMNFRTGFMWKTESATPRMRQGPEFCGKLGHRPWLFVLAFAAMAGRAGAQAPTVDTSVPPLPGSSGSLLGPLPGGGGGSFGNLPGAGGILGGRPGVSTPKGIPTTISTPGAGPGPTEMQMAISAPQPQGVSPTTIPFAGPLEISGRADDGPPGGLTLDQAIDVTLERSLDLRAKFFEIPMARADILQANLRSNPVFYQDGQLLQYRGPSTQFTRAAPGGPSQVDTNVTYPLDVSRKRQARTVTAARAERVLEAQFQDYVRNRIDDIYGAYVTALGARQTVRYARTSVEYYDKLAAVTKQLHDNQQIPLADLYLVENKLRIARLGARDAEVTYRKAKLDLGSFMNLKIEEIGSLELKGTIEDLSPPPPPVEELQKIALTERPDIAAMRLGISYAEAAFRLAKANAFSDIYVLWQPYTYQDNAPYGLRSQISWAVGVTVPIPIYNRNQGGIERAKINVTQSEVQLSDAQRQLLIDVEKAVQEYEVSRRLVADLRESVIPDARKVRDAAERLWKGGETSILNFLQAQLDFNDIVKQYVDTAVRHRLSMLSLNTTVGRRILP
jgi:outer membrane protein, heavy metal efflux system